MTTEPASGGNRRERRKAETRRRLLDAAIATFTAHGYEAATMDQIAAEADVARSTLFSYFRRKEDVITALLTELRAVINAIITRDRVTDADTETVLRDVLVDLAAWYQDDRFTHRTYVRGALRAGGPLLPGWFDNAMLFAEVIRAGQHRGDVDPDVDPEVAGRLLLDGHLGVLYRWASEHYPDRDLEASLLAMLPTFLAGIRTRRVPAADTAPAGAAVPTSGSAPAGRRGDVDTAGRQN